MRLNTMLGLAAMMALTSINLGFSIGDDEPGSGGDSAPTTPEPDAAQVAEDVKAEEGIPGTEPDQSEEYVGFDPADDSDDEYASD